MKLFFFDVETTGLNSYSDKIWQLSYQIEIDRKLLGGGTLYATPGSDFKWSPKAKEMAETAVAGITQHALTLDEWLDSSPSQEEMHAELCRALDNHVSKFDSADKFFSVGYNTNFDYSFLYSFGRNVGDRYFPGSYICWPAIDVASLLALSNPTGWTNLKTRKLADAAKLCGIELDESRLHNAQYDIELTRALYHKAMEDLSNAKEPAL